MSKIKSKHIEDQAVTLEKMADMDTASLIYRTTSGSGVPEVNTLSTLKTDLGLTGSNSGDGAVVTASYTSTDTLTTSNHIVFADSSGGAFTLTLPAAANAVNMICIKKTDSSMDAVTIDGNGTETIDGELTYLLDAQYMYVNIVSDGSNWLIVGNN